MGSNSVGENEHVLEVWEADRERLALMHKKVLEPPKILSSSAGRSSCCIYRVPHSLVEINGKAYQPHIVSIGPYHHGQPHLKMIEEHKWRFLAALLKRTEKKGLALEDYLKALKPLEARARDCYSEAIRFDCDEFIEMMVLDGCFIIEMFRKVAMVVPVESEDPLFSMSWIYPFFSRDLIRLENQIPFFILQRLFELTTMPGEENGPSLSKLALVYFNLQLQRSDEVLDKYSNLQGKHLLDFLRLSLIPQGYEEPRNETRTPTHVIHCISKLRRAGIKLKAGKEDSFLAVNFRHGVIKMPKITIDDFMSSFLQNCVAYEQCHKHCSKHMTTYCTLLDYLINTYKDVEHLVECNIIENYFGTDGDIAKLVNNMGKDVSFDGDLCYLAKLFNQVHEYYRSSLHVHWASFKYTYFNTPWSFISALAALVLLVLTILQTAYTILSYVKG